MTENQIPYTVSTLEELKAAEGNNVMILSASDEPNAPGTVYRGSGIDSNDGEPWYDLEGNYYVDSEYVQLPALVFYAPEKPAGLSDELIESGFVLVTEDTSISTSQVPNWINPDYLTDVTNSEVPEFKGIAEVAQRTGYLGNRVYLISDSQVVEDWGVNGLHVFRSKKKDGAESAFLILKGQQSADAQKALDDFTANHGLKGRITPEPLNEDDTWKGRK